MSENAATTPPAGETPATPQTEELAPDTFTLKVKGTVYTCRKLSGFVLMNIMGVKKNGQVKESGEMYRDLITACLISPKLKREEIEELSPSVFTPLGKGILDGQADKSEDFQESLTG